MFTNKVKDTCFSFDSCNKCSFQKKCVWCEVENQCVEGDNEGPHN